MRNILKSNSQAIFNTSDRLADNIAGGVAIWEVPPTYCCAFNPIVFKRTKFLHEIDTYEPTQKIVPNFVYFDNEDGRIIYFSRPTASPLVVVVSTDRGELTCKIGAGNDEWGISGICGEIYSILSVSFFEGERADYVQDHEYIYIRKGASYYGSDFICSPDMKVAYRDTAIETVHLCVYKQNGSYETMIAESYKGVCRFDISSLVKTWLNTSLKDFKGAELVKDNALFTKFTIKGIGGSGYAETFVALNAVAQIGEPSDRTGYVGSVLTTFEHLNYYKGFELDYSILAGAQPIETERGEIEAKAVTRIRVNDLEQKLLDHNLSEITDDRGLPITTLPNFDTKVFARRTPRNPFYLRWINRLGGVDYFMFALRQKISTSVKSTSSYTPVINDVAQAKFNQKVYAMTTESTVTIGAEGLTDAEFNALSAVPYSPLIEWYDEARGKWIELSIHKSALDYARHDATHSIEFTLLLPMINTQF